VAGSPKFTQVWSVLVNTTTELLQKYTDEREILNWTLREEGVRLRTELKCVNVEK
jgi:hypothetical protein